MSINGTDPSVPVSRRYPTLVDKVYIYLAMSCAFVILFSTSLLFFQGTVNEKFGQGIIDATVISPVARDANNEVWQRFISTESPSNPKGNPIAFLNVWMWNITNPSDVLNGLPPQLEEVGPYVYEEHIDRLDPTFSHDLQGFETIHYSEWKRYEFSRKATPEALKESDVMVIPNIVFTAWRHLADQSELFRSLFLKNYAEGTTNPFGDDMDDFHRLFTTRTVSEVLWGYQDLRYEALIGSAQLFPGMLGPVTPSAEAAKKNTDNLYEIYTGSDDMSRRNSYYRWKNATFFSTKNVFSGAPTPIWPTYEANAFNGATDGTSFPLVQPSREFTRHMKSGTTSSLQKRFGLSTESTLRSVLPDANRVLDFTFTQTVPVSSSAKDEDRMLLRFSLASWHDKSSDDVPVNAEWDGTGPAGMFNLTRIKLAPLVMTRPHFLKTAPEVSAKLRGLSPSSELHETQVDVEPRTGMVLAAKKRTQVSVHTQGPYVPGNWLSEVVDDLFLPVAHFSLEGKAPEDTLKDLFSQLENGELYSSITSSVPLGIILGTGFMTVCFLGAVLAFVFGSCCCIPLSFCLFFVPASQISSENYDETNALFLTSETNT